MDVSVCILTYNHAPYIAQAIEGTLMQRLPHAWEVLVGDDGSTDGTAEIVRQYAERYPNRIRAFHFEYPAGHVRTSGQRNMRNLLERARGRYIAVVEGDDYWTSPEKLRRQVEFLDLHPDYSECFHNATVRHEGHPERDSLYLTGPQAERWDVRAIASDGWRAIPTCSVMFRRGLFELPRWFETLRFGDWSMNLLNAHQGPIGYLDEVFATYRVHVSGTWSMKPSTYKLNALSEGARVLDRHFDYRYHAEFGGNISRWQTELAFAAMERRDFGGTLRHLAGAIGASPRHFGAHTARALVAAFRSA